MSGSGWHAFQVRKTVLVPGLAEDDTFFTYYVRGGWLPDLGAFITDVCTERGYHGRAINKPNLLDSTQAHFRAQADVVRRLALQDDTILTSFMDEFANVASTVVDQALTNAGDEVDSEDDRAERFYRAILDDDMECIQ